MTDAHSEGHGPRQHTSTLVLGALGVVYGDIGTSPLYAMRECFHGSYAVRPTPSNILGALSLIVWSLVLVVSIKYLVFVMCADNDGEGGILALTALIHPGQRAANRRRWLLVMLGLFGAALFYGDGMIYALVLLATLATIIASQAVISGAFSLTRQAVRLGYCPRLRIRHTSAREIGQIYIPGINWALMLACIGLVLGFRSSSNLAAAYGIAVTATMVITSILLYPVARERWGWHLFSAGLLIALFLSVDLAFFGANSLKILHGGWFPLVMAGAVYTLMVTWWQGRRILAQRLQAEVPPLAHFLQEVKTRQPPRVPGTAVFMYGHPTVTPPALSLNFKHNKVLHERVVILTVVTEETARVPARERIACTPLGEAFYRVGAHYGFMESPDIPIVLDQVKRHGLHLALEDITYFFGRETLLATKKPGMAAWRERLFALMVRNAQSATTFFRIPPDRVVELGSQVEL